MFYSSNVAGGVITPTIIHISANGTSTTSTGSLDTTGINFIAITVTYYQQAAAPTISDSQGGMSNTYTALTAYCVTSQTCSQIFYTATPPTHVGAGHTFTFTCSGCYAGIAVIAASHMNISSVFQSGTDKGNTSSGAATLQPSVSISPTGPSLIITTDGNNAPLADVSINDSFTITDSWNYGAAFGGEGAYLLQPSGSAIQPTWSTSLNVLYSTAIAAFSY